MLIAAIRCYSIHTLRSSLTCTNGCSCWSADEENSPGVFLTMDALYRLSGDTALLKVREPDLAATGQAELLATYRYLWVPDTRSPQARGVQKLGCGRWPAGSVDAGSVL
jgi:hypothetical protein